MIHCRWDPETGLAHRGYPVWCSVCFETNAGVSENIDGIYLSYRVPRGRHHFHLFGWVRSEQVWCYYQSSNKMTTVVCTSLCKYQSSYKCQSYLCERHSINNHQMTLD